MEILLILHLHPSIQKAELKEKQAAFVGAKPAAARLHISPVEGILIGNEKHENGAPAARAWIINYFSHLFLSQL